MVGLSRSERLSKLRRNTVLLLVLCPVGWVFSKLLWHWLFWLGVAMFVLSLVSWLLEKYTPQLELYNEQQRLQREIEKSKND